MFMYKCSYYVHAYTQYDQTLSFRQLYVQGFIISETKNPSYREYKMFFGTSNYII